MGILGALFATAAGGANQSGDIADRKLREEAQKAQEARAREQMMLGAAERGMEYDPIRREPGRLPEVGYGQTLLEGIGGEQPQDPMMGMQGVPNFLPPVPEFAPQETISFPDNPWSYNAEADPAVAREIAREDRKIEADKELDEFRTDQDIRAAERRHELTMAEIEARAEASRRNPTGQTTAMTAEQRSNLSQAQELILAFQEEANSELGVAPGAGAALGMQLRALGFESAEEVEAVARRVNPNVPGWLPPPPEVGSQASPPIPPEILESPRMRDMIQDVQTQLRGGKTPGEILQLLESVVGPNGERIPYEEIDAVRRYLETTGAGVGG